MDEKKIRGSIRLFASGGLFGYFGIFSNSTLGKMRWYSRRSKPCILINTKNGMPILLSPNKPSEFIEQVAELNGKHSGLSSAL
ncbi:MAG: PH domain-containing protein [Chitinophagales bacterium]